jgi:hypothetical protein
MSEYLHAVGLAVMLVLTFIHIGSAIAGVVNGRVKLEPNQPWVVFLEHPVKFVACLLWYLGFAAMFAPGIGALCVILVSITN